MSQAERVRNLVVQLITGWDERVEYGEVVVYHTKTCDSHDMCGCPEIIEARVRPIRHGALLAQIQESVRLQSTGGAEQGRNPNKAGSRPPGNTASLHLLDELTVDARFWFERLHDETFEHPAAIQVGKTAPRILLNLLPMCERLDHTHPALLRELSGMLVGYIKRARLILGYDRPQSLLADTVCGECKGNLAVASDASTAVRCIGTDQAPGCGVVYQRWRWLELAREMQA